jgi:hypothetical protein
LKRFDHLYLKKTQFLDTDIFEYYFIFEGPLTTLESEIQERQKKGLNFTTPEILQILDQVLQAAVSLEDSKIPQDSFDLRTHNLIYNAESGHTVLIDTGISFLQ